MSAQSAALEANLVPPPNFHQHFRQQISILQEGIAALAAPSLSTSERKSNSDGILARATKLAAELADASGELPSYDQRSYSQALKEVQDKLAITQASHTPKPKFSFKNKRLAAPSSEANSASTSRSVTPSHLREPENSPNRGLPTPALASPPAHLAFSREHSQTRPEIDKLVESNADDDSSNILIKAVNGTYIRSSHSKVDTNTEATQHGQNCIVSEVTSSVVNLTPSPDLPPPPYLTLKNVKTSLLLAPSINGPAHITGLQDSILVLSCRQFRMHDSRNVDVYLFCSSRPIIENCANIRFAKLPENIFRVTDGTDAVRGKSINLFNQVDDFKWLRAEASPNWTLMKEDGQITEEAWLEVLERLQMLEEQSRTTDVDGRGALAEQVRGVLLQVGLGYRTPG